MSETQETVRWGKAVMRKLFEIQSLLPIHREKTKGAWKEVSPALVTMHHQLHDV